MTKRDFLGLVAGAGLVACSQTHSHVATAAAAEPYEGELAAFERADAANPPASCSTLFLGSSSIRLWASLEQDFPDRPTLNRGFGGSTIADSVRLFDRLVTPYRPAAIVFYAGENDISQGRSVERVFADFEELLALKRARLGDTPMWFVSAKPTPARWADRPAQVALNDKVRELSQNSGDLGYIDVASPMLTLAGTPKDLFREDHLHMTASGYRIWTNVVSAALQDAPLASHCA